LTITEMIMFLEGCREEYGNLPIAIQHEHEYYGDWIEPIVFDRIARGEDEPNSRELPTFGNILVMK